MSNSRLTPAPLAQWFSSARMSRYVDHPAPEALYLWNTHLTKTYLADIEHLEVLLRNCIHYALSRRYGDRWFDDTRIPFNDAAKKNIRKAKKRVGREDAPPGKIIAELTFDFWRFLLSSHYQAVVWPQVRKALKTTPESRRQFEDLVVIVYKMRNRCSHHESIVHQHDRAREVAYLNSIDNAIQKVACFIDPDAAEWIKQNSRVPALRTQRP
ncbi:Abi family protein [Corynebacterium sp. CCUG 51687]|uniref:Abi family protein n=1 Tax=Corynebacterium sp. CCUG 51687 TaxID=2823897 RepID=UPI002109CC4C|nr:Abi family protein [Corynebacterium sp. CCUG 51687]MCQ4612468.1 Abi family protein [Corynebacterium sp. CCUG 51687]